MASIDSASRSGAWEGAAHVLRREFQERIAYGAGGVTATDEDTEAGQLVYSGEIGFGGATCADITDTETTVTCRNGSICEGGVACP